MNFIFSQSQQGLIEEKMGLQYRVVYKLLMFTARGRKGSANVKFLNRYQDFVKQSCQPVKEFRKTNIL